MHSIAELVVNILILTTGSILSVFDNYFISPAGSVHGTVIEVSDYWLARDVSGNDANFVTPLFRY